MISQPGTFWVRSMLWLSSYPKFNFLPKSSWMPNLILLTLFSCTTSMTHHLHCLSINKALITKSSSKIFSFTEYYSGSILTLCKDPLVNSDLIWSSSRSSVPRSISARVKWGKVLLSSAQSEDFKRRKKESHITAKRELGSNRSRQKEEKWAGKRGKIRRGKGAGKDIRPGTVKIWANGRVAFERHCSSTVLCRFGDFLAYSFC